MTTKIDTTPRLYDPEKVEAIAAELNAGDPDWSYVVENKGAYSLIAIYDEDGEFVAHAGI